MIGKIFFLVFFIAFTIRAELIILAPKTPASLPIILAADKIPGVKVKLFNNHSKANAAFINNKADLLYTGISVGKKLYGNGVPVCILSSHISRLSYLVSNDSAIKDLSDLKKEKIYLPFSGSPMDEILKFIINKRGFDLSNFNFSYLIFPSSFLLFKEQKIKVAAYPEPFVSKLSSSKKINIILDFNEEWKHLTGEAGYPQVGLFAKKDNLKKNYKLIERVISSLQKITNDINKEENIGKYAQEKSKTFNLSPEIMLSALKNITFIFQKGDILKKSVKKYYKIIGSPLDDSYQDFFARN